MDKIPKSQGITSADADLVSWFRHLLNLKADMDIQGTVETIKANITFHSANAWTLVFAIFIASVGLNINSTAVIIGAMLISPLMGPIVGAGYALGTYDYGLLKSCLRNLLAAVVISVFASTLYFLLSPLSEVQSELLARTRPSFYDVLIAFFGGAAGIVALSRREKGNNVIPGVAIATALMPPLCTAGFGLATRNFGFLLGALYLFVINSVFITISTYIFVRYLGFHESKTVESSQQTFINKIIAYIGTAVLIPSFIMAWYLQQESSFFSKAKSYIKNELRNNNIIVLDQDLNYDLKKPSVRLLVFGDLLDKEQLEKLKERARIYDIEPASIEIDQSTTNLKEKMDERVSSSENLVRKLQIELQQKDQLLNAHEDKMELFKKVNEEIKILFPNIKSVSYLGEMNDYNSKKSMIMVRWKKSPTKIEQEKSNNFLLTRFSDELNCCVNVRDL